MDLPKVFRKVGTTDDSRQVYIEDYVLQYLRIIREGEEAAKERMLFWGKRERTSQKEIYVVYGICGQAEEKDELFCQGGKRNYEFLGSLDMDLWKQGRDFCQGIRMGIGNEERQIGGYYIFYDADDTMKEWLGRCYGKSRNPGGQPKAKGQSAGKTAELVALSEQKRTKGTSPFLWIRIAAIGILVILCAIAVTTINEYDRISDFVQTAVRTSEILEVP